MFRYIVVFFLFSFLSKAQIKSVDSYISVDSTNLIHLKTILDINKTDKIEVTLPRTADINSIKINEDNLNLRVGKESNNIRLFISSSEEFNRLTLLYDLISKENNRSFKKTSNVLFLLPDSNYLPENPIYSRVSYLAPKIITGKVNYSQTVIDNGKNLFSMPYVIAGDFKTLKNQNLDIYYPSNIHYNEKKTNEIIRVIKNSYDYYEKIFGIPSKLNDFSKVFFLNRSGGHSIPKGIILDQRYISNDENISNALRSLIAHEVAHFWWGNNLESNQYSLTEGLAEYSAGLYMNEIEGYNLSKTYSNKNNELEISPLEKIKFDTIKPEDNEDNTYRKFSYKKLPILLNGIEYIMGKNNFINYLNNFFKINQTSDKLITYDNFVDGFDNNIKSALYNDIFNKNEKPWIDVFCKSIKKNIVEYHIENFTENYIIKVPVTIIDDNGKDHIEFIEFNNNSDIIKEYPYLVKRVIIDPEFKISQLSAINDIFDTNNRLDIFASKYPRLYDEKFYTFANIIIKFLFHDEKLNFRNQITSQEAEKIKKLSAITQKVTTKGFLLYIDERENKFKLLISFDFSNKNKIGFISGSYKEISGEIILNTLEKIKL